MRRYEHGGASLEDGKILLDFSVNLNPMGMPPSAERAIVSRLPEYARYPDPACRALGAALALRHGLIPEQILCGNGAAALIFALCACRTPRNALVLAPTFSEYERSVLLFGGRVREHRLKQEEGFSLTRSLLAELTPDTDLAVICNPNNPTGLLAEPQLLAEIAGVCRDNGTLLLVDECFLDFTRGESLLPRLEEFPNLLVLRAFTKLFAMAGLRLGTLYCADRELLADIARFSPPWSVSAVAQAAGLAALDEPDWAERTRRLVERERPALAEGLEGLGLHVFPGQANYLLVKSERLLWAPLRNRGILLRACANFTGLDERFVRIGLKTETEHAQLLRAMKEVLHG